MRNWHSIYEILKYPLGLVFLGTILTGIGMTVTSPALGIASSVNNQFLLSLAELMLKTGQFIIVNFPILFMMRLAMRRGGSAATIFSAFLGYIMFLITTMYFTSTNLPTTAYSSILGLNVSHSYVGALSNATHYPLQTGLIGALIVAAMTLWAYRGARNKNEYGFFSFISKEVSCTIRTMFLCVLAGIVIAYIWPVFINYNDKILNFIVADTTNPINLTIYGMLDRFLSVFNLGTWIRQPFWYGISGGSWVNVAGASITGDVNIWTAQLGASALTGTAGKFITPYYVLNIFAVPGMIWAMLSLTTDKMERRKTFFLCLIAVIVSILFGTLLPLELLLLFLCPLLFFIHILYTGVLYAVLYSMNAFLGYHYTDTSIITAMPGTLPEFISYASNPGLQKTLIVVGVTGVISFVLYFLLTRLYFKHMALDLFHTDAKTRMVNGTLRAVGGVENIKMIHSGISSLTIGVYDSSKVNIDRLKHLGSYRIYETRAGYHICYGASSTMIRMGILDAMREGMRSVNNK